jgi:hypothetical protein
MAATLIRLSHFVRGIPTEEQRSAPLANAPYDAKVRFRFRNTDWARCYVKTESGIAEYIPEFKDGKWWIDESLCQGFNPRRLESVI